MRLRARLFAVRRGLPPAIGPEGIPSAPNDPARPAEFFLACGYFAAGPRVIRLDRLERAAALLSRLSQTGPFVPPRELPDVLGCRAEELPAVVAALGYLEREGRFERRGRATAASRRRGR
jgi:ATP-dependent RNA helicase SUPV3L1/SUV3